MKSTEHEKNRPISSQALTNGMLCNDRIALEVETRARVTPAHAGSARIVISPKRNVLHDAADLPTRALGRHLGDIMIRVDMIGWQH